MLSPTLWKAFCSFPSDRVLASPWRWSPKKMRFLTGCYQSSFLESQNKH
uniref:Uncharacterized protein n=1 Tax=Anguilla anguilla TaxID=7936 RepID=A0A0E9SMF4_ANGAN